MSEVVFREFKDSDSNILEDAIRKTWNFDKMVDSKTAKIGAEIYLLGCLSEQSYTCVAERDGVTLGIIMVNNENRKKVNLKYSFRLMISMLKLTIIGKAFKMKEIQDSIHNINKELLKSTNKKYDGAIELFIVTEDSRGLGIGKKLYKKALEYMKSDNIKDFYLYTDTMCNYKFYEKQGMNRRCEKVSDVIFNNKTTFFLYDEEVNKEIE